MLEQSERVPPQNTEAEDSVLGSMLIEREAVLTALEILTAEDFYKEQNRIIFRRMAEMAEVPEAVDLVTLSDKLRSTGELERIGGMAELARLANFVPTAANVEYYARIVAEKAILRRLIAAATEIAATAYRGTDEVDELLDKSEELIFQVARRRSRQSYVQLKDVLVETLEKLEYMASHGGETVGIPSGLGDLDRLTSGFQPSDLIILAARPSVGKTSLGLNMARNVALKADLPVVVFSLEMSKEQVAQRLLCSEAASSQNCGTDFSTRKSGAFSCPREAGEAKIYIDDTPSISVMELRTSAGGYRPSMGWDGHRDYMQLMRPSRRRKTGSKRSRRFPVPQRSSPAS